MPVIGPENLPGAPDSRGDAYPRKVLIAIGFSLGALLLVVVVWKALYVLLMIFAGMLIGIFLHFLKCRLSTYTRLPPSLSLVIVLTVVFVLLGLFIMVVAPVVKEQAIATFEQIPESIRQLRIYLLKFKVITVPPMLILSVQVLLLYLIGFLGVVLAMPLIACVIVIVQMLYVEDILGDLQSKGKIGI